MTELYTFLESKNVVSAIKGILWSRDLLVKTLNWLIGSSLANQIAEFSIEY